MGKKSKRRQHKNKNRNRNSRRGGSVSGEDSSSVTTTTSASVSASTKQYPQEDPVPVVAADNDNEDEENETENEDDEKLPSFTKAKIWSTLTEGQKMFVLSLNEASQSHLFESWTESDNVKDQLSLVEQLKRMDDGSKSRGGILGYISNAKKLLAASKAGLNPLEGYVPSVPTYGDRYELGTVEYMNMEGAGIVEVGSCGFVLVAGGLGERLGYSGIKLGLPTEMATETCYLQYYIEMILAIQGRYGEGKLLPLCIMVSNDTCPGTMKLLEANNYFGMEKTQITIVQQGDGVPALMDNDARIAVDPNDPNKILAKPHGHGDIHALMFDHKVAEEWSKNGIRWAIFCQDTNGLAFHTLPLALGVSKRHNLIMNSIAVPRKAKQAIGAITKLVNTTTKNQRYVTQG